MKKEALLVFVIIVALLIVSCSSPGTNNSPLTASPASEAAPPSSSRESTITQGEEIKPEGDFGFDLSPEKDELGWKQTSGPLGGTVIRMIPSRGTVWASLYSGGIYELQVDNSWKQIAVGQGIPEVRAFDIVVDPINSAVVYVPERIKCLAKTTNNGVAWKGLCDNLLKATGSQDPDFSTLTLTLDPDDRNIIYLPGNTHDGTSMLLVSSDGGNTWEKRFTFDKHYDLNNLFFLIQKCIFHQMPMGCWFLPIKARVGNPLTMVLRN